jgi:transcriptional regulator with XRE-family HTH domain
VTGEDASAHLNEMDVGVGARMRDRRKALSISQKRLGEAVGVSFQQIQKYEKGVNRIGAGQLQVIAKLLQVEVAYFYGEAGVAPRQSGFAEDASSHDVLKILKDAEAREVAAAFASLTDPLVRRQILETVKKLSAKTR